MDTKTFGLNTGTVGNTLAHELIAQDEQNVGIFFSALAIQMFLQRSMLEEDLSSPEFINIFADIETFATQRMFVKNLLSNRKFAKVTEEMQNIFLEYCDNPGKNPQPYLLFLSRINKAFLIRQIFNHGDQILEKYQFIDDYLNKEQVDLDRLNTKIWHFPIEQQILILTRIYTTIKDQYVDRKKSIILSYKENVDRMLQDVDRNPSRYDGKKVQNLKRLKASVQEYLDSTQA